MFGAKVVHHHGFGSRLVLRFAAIRFFIEVVSVHRYWRTADVSAMNSDISVVITAREISLVF